MKLRNWLQNIIYRLGSLAKGRSIARNRVVRGTYYWIQSRFTKSEIEGNVMWMPHGRMMICVNPEDGQKPDHEPEVAREIKSRLTNGDTAIDIGAHYGHHTLTMADAVGAAGTVLTVEPHPRTTQYLRETIAGNNLSQVRLLPHAVSPTADAIDLVAPRKSTSVFRSPEKARHGEGERIEVEAISMDNLIGSTEMNRADLVKIDIEGQEAMLLSQSDLSRIRTIIVEIHYELLSNEELTELESVLCSFDEMKEVETGEDLTDLSGRPGHVVVSRD